MRENWYRAAISAKWNDPKVQEAILALLLDATREGCSELLPAVEDAVWGPRVECKHGCCEMNLSGAPRCYNCEEPLP